MDEAAKIHLIMMKGQGQRLQERVFAEPWPLWVAGERISAKVGTAVSEVIHGSKILKYWEDKGRFEERDEAAIDWNCVEKAMKEVNRTRRVWVTKHVSGFCASGKMMLRWKKRESAKCPRCDETEDAKHVWLCRGAGADEVWLAAIAKLRTWLVKKKTLPNLVDVLCDRLEAWRKNTLPSVSISTFLGMKDATFSQDKIGWGLLLEGLAAARWSDVQQRFYEWIGSRKTGKRWLISVIQKMWDVAWDMWDHRNKVLHECDTGLERNQRNEEITAQFQLGSNTLTTDARALFRPGLEVLLNSSPEIQQAWLIRIGRSRLRFCHQQEEMRQAFTSERQILHRWLHGRR